MDQWKKSCTAYNVDMLSKFSIVIRRLFELSISYTSFIFFTVRKLYQKNRKQAPNNANLSVIPAPNVSQKILMNITSIIRGKETGKEKGKEKGKE